MRHFKCLLGHDFYYWGTISYENLSTGEITKFPMYRECCRCGLLEKNYKPAHYLENTWYKISGDIEFKEEVSNDK